MSIHPTLRYTDARAAITFLTGALGFHEEHVSTCDDGTVQHAELSFGGDVVMLGTRAAEPGQWDTGRAVTYLAVDDADAAHERAVAAGAQVTMGLTDQPYGSREFAVADQEGNVWSVGTYRPTVRT
jgi:uncharacterized glyoxalase superfamily protein PhnB